jgi:SAM-dependent methyltransferase
MDRYRDYDPFAWLYTTHWGAEYHEQAWAVLDRLFLHRLVRGSAILDLCCGDGRLTNILDQKGYEVVGIDGSEAMLEFARERCPKVEFIAADARQFETGRRFDAVISTFDALNHVMSSEELELVFRRVLAALNPAGYFAFDLNREEAYTELWPQTFSEVEPEMVSVSQGWYNASLRQAHCRIVLFRLIDEEWKRTDFELSQYCHREKEVLGSLYAAGFADAEVYDASEDLGMYGNIGQGRSYYLARRGM